MSTTTPWHVRDEVLERYGADPRGLDEVTAASAEAHLLACDRCRQRVVDATAPSLLADSWDAITDVIDRPRRTLAERVLSVLGVSPSAARLAGATPRLQLAWLGAVAAMAAAAVLAGDRDDLGGLLLLLAPLLPLGSVAMAFLPGEEPGGEAVLAAPISGLRLVLTRSIAVGTAAIVVLLTATVALPGATTSDVAWLLPSLALAAGALALGTWMPVERAAIGLAFGWIATIVGVHMAQVAPIGQLVLFHAPGQLGALLVTIAAAAITTTRRDHLALLGGPR